VHRDQSSQGPQRLADVAAPCALSIVTTLYRSRPYLDDFMAACRAALDAIGEDDVEWVFVDDGSPDDSAAWVTTARQADSRVRLVALSRNFGHHQAAMAGLCQARGKRVFLVDCDMEVSPGVLVPFWQRQRETAADVVYGYQESRKGAWVERVGGKVFWRLFNLLSDTKVPESIVTERLMTQAYVQALTSLGDRNLFMAGVMHWAGFVQLGMPVLKKQRTGGSTYAFWHRLALLSHAITSFSAKPLYAALWVGVFALVASLTNAAYIVLRKLIDPMSTMTGFPTIVALLTGLFGVMMVGLGIIGVYVARVFVQTQQRPLYIVRHVDQPAVREESHVD